MAHQEQLDFIASIKKISPAHFSNCRVLEIGSLDINGTTRAQFSGCAYTGIDVAAGPGVDVVCEGQKFGAPEASFDTVISCEVMEHNPFWKETFLNMVRLAKPDGLIIMTCGTLGRPEHGTSRTNADASPLTVSKGWEYYKNLTEADFVSGGLASSLDSWRFLANWRAYDLYFVGSKSALPEAQWAQIEALARHYRQGSFWTMKGLKRYVKANWFLRR
jgi:SAM-dependent methyltransferase